MFGRDEFGKNRLYPVAFVIVLAVLGCGAVATSQTMWETPVAAGAGAGAVN